MLLYAFDPPDSSRKVGTQEPAIRRFVGESANGSKPQVDSGGGILSLFEVDPVARHHGLVEGEAGFRAVPVDEFTDRMVIRALGAVGGQTVKDCCFRLFEIRQFQNGFGSELTLLVSYSCSLHDAGKRLAASRLVRGTGRDLSFHTSMLLAQKKSAIGMHPLGPVWNKK